MLYHSGDINWTSTGVLYDGERYKCLIIQIQENFEYLIILLSGVML